MQELNLINQLRFTRSEFRQGFSGISEQEGRERFLPINSTAWMVGHLAWHEQSYWLKHAQGKILFPELNDISAFGKPPADVSLKEMVGLWEAVTRAADEYLSHLTKDDLIKKLIVNGKEVPANIGTLISRVIYHYWYHTGEMQAVRQLFGHQNLPSFVSDNIETEGQFYLDD